MNEKEPVPGDGIKKLQTSRAFRIINFELYTAPNKIVMGFGLFAMTACIGYIAYMRHKYEGMGYYPALEEDGREVYVQKKSKWD